MKATFTWTVTCDACGWSYPPPGKGTIAVKSDAEANARAHRLHGCRDTNQPTLPKANR